MTPAISPYNRLKYENFYRRFAVGLTVKTGGGGVNIPFLFSKKGNVQKNYLAKKLERSERRAVKNFGDVSDIMSVTDGGDRNYRVPQQGLVCGVCHRIYATKNSSFRSFRRLLKTHWFSADHSAMWTIIYCAIEIHLLTYLLYRVCTHALRRATKTALHIGNGERRRPYDTANA